MKNKMSKLDVGGVSESGGTYTPHKDGKIDMRERVTVSPGGGLFLSCHQAMMIGY